jgi:hypothetical protein
LAVNLVETILTDDEQIDWISAFDGFLPDGDGLMEDDEERAADNDDEDLDGTAVSYVLLTQKAKIWGSGMLEARWNLLRTSLKTMMRSSARPLTRMLIGRSVD